MNRSADLHSQQMTFAAHLRDPSRCPAPVEIEDRRMKIYRELFYNNIESFVSGAFPVIRSLYSDEKWHRLVRNFFSSYRCQTPYFIEIAQEFLTFLQHQYQLEPDDYPFLLELAHYEWVELAVDASETELPIHGYDVSGDLLRGRPFLSPLAFVLSYEYPVHQISPSNLPRQKPVTGTFLIVYRNADYQVKFMEINAVTASLLSILQQDETCTGIKAVETLGQEIANIDIETVIEGAAQALEHMRQVGIILGVREVR